MINNIEYEKNLAYFGPFAMNKLIRNKGGLRGRVTTRIRIKPFTLAECEKYNTANKLGLSKKQIAECAMIMGGIPYYWSFLDREKSLAQNIDYLFFNEDGELYGEFDELYSLPFSKSRKLTLTSSQNSAQRRLE